jgi:hypothetical protein
MRLIRLIRLLIASVGRLLTFAGAGDRSATTVLAWLDHQTDACRHEIRWGVLDVSGPYRRDDVDQLRPVGGEVHDRGATRLPGTLKWTLAPGRCSSAC